MAQVEHRVGHEVAGVLARASDARETPVDQDQLVAAAVVAVAAAAVVEEIVGLCQKVVARYAEEVGEERMVLPPLTKPD